MFFEQQKMSPMGTTFQSLVANNPVINNLKSINNNNNNNNGNAKRASSETATSLSTTIASWRKSSTTPSLSAPGTHPNDHFYRPAPSEVAHRNMRFLITDRPSDVTIQSFIQELKKHGCHQVVRVCEPTYNTKPLENEQIRVFDWEFPDGQPPPAEVRDKWIQLLKTIFEEKPGCCVAVHCVAGLGRAPVMVALALMESGMKYADAIDLIRYHRRGAINRKQMVYLEAYKPHGWLRKRDKECCIM